jgi:unsaturated rhamnogalacturonyl hydrolase
MAYSMLKEVRLDFLPQYYQKYGVEAFEGICEKYQSDKDGKLYLGESV